jgi:ring-1,2-phenylacetyl-CoA epoxidase subunit PaaE
MSQTFTFKITDKIQETAKAVTLVLVPQQHNFNYQAGQFLTFIFQFDQEEVRRSYSICTAPNVDDFLAITVKKIANGLVSKHLTETVKIGDILEALPPAGQFILPKLSNTTDIFLIGGGSGITPLFGLLKYALVYSNARIVLVNSNRNQQQIIFKNQLNEWIKRYPKRFKTIHFISQPKQEFDNHSPNETFNWGYLSNFRIEQIIEQERTALPENTHFFLCGPEGVMLKSRMVIGAMGFPKENIHREIFTIKKSFRPAANQLINSIVTLKSSSKEETFKVEAGETILEAALKVGIYIPYNCKSGICTICSCECTLGSAEMYTQEGLFTSDNLKGTVFTCVGYPKTEKLELIIG